MAKVVFIHIQKIIFRKYHLSEMLKIVFLSGFTPTDGNKRRFEVFSLLYLLSEVLRSHEYRLRSFFSFSKWRVGSLFLKYDNQCLQEDRYLLLNWHFRAYLVSRYSTVENWVSTYYVKPSWMRNLIRMIFPSYWNSEIIGREWHQFSHSLQESQPKPGNIRITTTWRWKIKDSVTIILREDREFCTEQATFPLKTYRKFYDVRK